MWSAPDALRSDGHPRIRSDSLWWLTVCENGSFSSLVYLLNIFKHDDLPLSYSFFYVYRSVTWGFTNKTTWKPSVKPGTSRFMVGFRRVNPVDPRWPGSTLKAIARHSLGWTHQLEVGRRENPMKLKTSMVTSDQVQDRVTPLNKHAVYFGMSKGTFKAKNPRLAGWWGCVKTYFLYLYLINMLFSASFLIGVDQWPYVKWPYMWYICMVQKLYDIFVHCVHGYTVFVSPQLQKPKVG